jgi:hypothetical protein
VLKEPGKALEYLLEQNAAGRQPAMTAVEGIIQLGLDEDVLGFTPIDLYARFNPDGSDIGEAITQAEKIIRAGEMDYPY